MFNLSYNTSLNKIKCIVTSVIDGFNKNSTGTGVEPIFSLKSLTKSLSDNKLLGVNGNIILNNFLK